MAVLPAQPSGAKLYVGFYVEDYAGNNASFVSPKTIDFDTDLALEMEAYVGYAFIGLLAMGIVFSISYRIHTGVKSIKKAKKVATAVKKAPVKKTASPGKKLPISSDIETKTCPICKAKVGAEAAECPYCHKRF